MNGVTRNAVFKSIDDSKGRMATLRQGPGRGRLPGQLAVRDPGLRRRHDHRPGLGAGDGRAHRQRRDRLGAVVGQSRFSEAERNKQGVNPTDTVQWRRNVLKMRLFDELIYNVDRHANNVLITEDFDLRLIDHSRAFRPYDKLKSPEVLTQFSRELLEGHQEARVPGPAQEGRPLPAERTDPGADQAPRFDPCARRQARQRARRGGGAVLTPPPRRAFAICNLQFAIALAIGYCRLLLPIGLLRLSSARPQ